MVLGAEKSYFRILQGVNTDGFTTVPAVVPLKEIEAVVREITQALVIGRLGVLDQAGQIYAARNVLRLWPKVTDMWRRSPLPGILHEILGPRFGLVRVLFFDK